MKLSVVLASVSAKIFEVELSNDVYNLGITRDLRGKMDFDRLMDAINSRGWEITPVFGGLASSEDIIRRNTGLTTPGTPTPYFDFEMIQLMRKHDLHRLYYVDTKDSSDVDVIEAALLPNSVVLHVSPPATPSIGGETNLRGTSTYSAPKNYADCSSYPCQGYLYKDETPSYYTALGTNAKRVWDEFGVRGEGVSAIIQEGGIIRRDLHNEIDQDYVVLTPDTNFSDHRTAVAGCILAKHDNWGVEGISPNVDKYIEMTWAESQDDVNNYESLMKVAQPGDVMNGSWQLGYGDSTFEEQKQSDPHCASNGGCMWSPVLSSGHNRAFNVLADLGVTVFMCAGNGGTNLNTPFFRKYSSVESRGPQTAAIVTAWDPKTDNPFGWSGYVSDAANSKDFLQVQFASWGGDVVTTSVNGDGYTTSFNGCSSATPIVTGTALLVQSAAKKYLGAPLPPQQVIDILHETGNVLTNTGPNQYQDMSQVRSPDVYEAVKKIVSMANAIPETEEPELPSICYPSNHTSTTTTVPPVTTTTTTTTPRVTTTTTTTTKPPTSSGCGSVPAYLSSQAYPSKCTDVCHNNKVWTSKWYVNPGEIPGATTWGGWHDTTTNGKPSGC